MVDDVEIYRITYGIIGMVSPFCCFRSGTTGASAGIPHINSQED